VTRRPHTFLHWMVDHLADLWLFCVVTPVLLYVLVGYLR
jgi:hypothetical protein